MTTIILFLTLITALLFSAVFAATPYKVTASRLNVRNQPGQSGAILGSLAQSSVVEVISIKNGWAEIRFNGQKAYISAQYITPTASNAEAKSNTSASTAASSSSNSSKPSTAENTNNTSSRKEKKEKSSASSPINGDYAVAGFHVSLGVSWTLHTSKLWVKNEWKDVQLGKNNAIHGLSAGVGFEYNGIVHRGRASLIMVGFRTGIYYDWFGTKKLTPNDLQSSEVDLGDYSDYLSLIDDYDLSEYMGGSGSGSSSLGFKTIRYSNHSITLPLQPQLSFEWQTSRGKHIGAGVFVGPIFEICAASYTITEYDGDNISLENSISGKGRWLKGGDGAPNFERLEKPYRAGLLNVMIGTGAFVQFGKFRIVASTDWGVSNYKSQRGGTVNEEKVPTYYSRNNRAANIGFQIVF